MAVSSLRNDAAERGTPMFDTQSAVAPKPRRRWYLSPGLLLATPILLYLTVFFLAPLLLVVGLSFMPSESTAFRIFLDEENSASRTTDATSGVDPADQGNTEERAGVTPDSGAERQFDGGQQGDADSQEPQQRRLAFTLDNYRRILAANYDRPFLVSIQLAAMSTVILLFACYPVAHGLAKTFGRLAPVLTMFFVMPLFVSETIRLYGWSLFFLKGGILNGLANLLGFPFVELMYTTPAIILGLVNIYLPFMLFPLVLGISLVDDALVAAARDLGATWLRAFLKIQLPLSMPGIVIGVLLTFVLTLGSMSESQILGGQKVMMVAHSIDFTFSWQQDWPLGAALSVILITLTLIAMLWLLSRLDIDKLFKRT